MRVFALVVVHTGNHTWQLIVCNSKVQTITYTKIETACSNVIKDAAEEIYESGHDSWLLNMQYQSVFIVICEWETSAVITISPRQEWICMKFPHTSRLEAEIVLPFLFVLQTKVQTTIRVHQSVREHKLFCLSRMTASLLDLDTDLTSDSWS